jgi:hypothetical protein
MSLASVGDAARGVGTIVCFRSLPVIGFVAVTRTVRLGPKLLVVSLFAAACVALRAWTLERAAALALAYGYFAALAALMPGAVRWLRRGRVTRGALFAGCAAAFLGLPCLFAPAAVRALVIVLGWDFQLASYSYCVEKARAREEASRAEGLFFVLVNPSLVYVHCGTRVGPPALRARGVWRGLLGVTVLFAASAVLTPLCRALGDRAVASPALGSSLLAWTLFGFFRFLLEYGRQSGLASLQIALLRQIGYEIPERYRAPLLASDPLDFWRRWNTYVSGWALRYVFWPIALRYRGTGRTWRLPVAQALGLVGTFAGIGLLHDAYAYAVALDTDWGSLRAFVAMGVLVTLWAAIPRAIRALSQGTFRAGSGPGLRVLSRVGFWIVAIGWAAWGWQ